jgi:TPR repeat protein
MAAQQGNDDVKAKVLVMRLKKRRHGILAALAASEHPIYQLCRVQATRRDSAEGARRKVAAAANAGYAAVAIGYMATFVVVAAERVRLLEKAAAFDDSFAQAILGRCYHKGRGVAVDLARAEALLRSAAAQNDANGLFYSRIQNR